MLKDKTIDLLRSIRGTYCQVFFANNTAFAVCLFVASFFDPCVGLSGFTCCIFTLLLAQLMGLNPLHTTNGTYSFNSLLTGLALGVSFKFNGNFVIMLFIASCLTLIITVFLASVSERNKLPFLSLPFIFAIWILLLNTRSLESNFLMPRGAPGCPVIWGKAFNDLSFTLYSILPKAVSAYFSAMAAVFFQTHLLAGILITVGLLLHSRIAFLLSVAGFLSGMLFTRLVLGNSNDAEYAVVAFNYILTALGLGAYFLIASRASFLLVLLITPVLGLMITALYKLSGLYYLPLYSLPFSVTVILVMALLNNRYTFKGLYLVYFQKFSPEKNLYAFRAFTERFKKQTDVAVHLPFFGEWTVSQGYEGKMTHKGDWRFALDFVVTDEQKRTFRFPGKTVTDFFCYGLPVLAPADGQVVMIEDGIEDNAVGDANLEQNWGNTIVIKHGENLYSKLSHLKKDSFKVKQGDHVKRGDVLAACGNSGRSPEPHLHFQMQATEFVGSKTLDYPLSSFVVKSPDGYNLRSFDTPKEGDVLLKPQIAPDLKQAFHLIPGMKFKFDVTEDHRTYEEEWEVFTDVYNNSYIQCRNTKAIAYFKNNGAMFYFTAYEGETACLLFYFYLGAYKVVFSQMDQLVIKDRLPVEGIQKGILKLLQDLAAPFFFFIDPVYTSTIKPADNAARQALKIVSEISTGPGTGKKLNCEISLRGNKITGLKLVEGKRCITANVKS